MVPRINFPTGLIWLLPILIIITLLSSSFWMWKDARILSYELLKSESNNASSQIQTRLEIFLFERGKDLSHLASLREYPFPSFLKQFSFDALGIITREKSYYAISFVDSSGDIIIRTGLDTLKDSSAPIYRMDLNVYIDIVASDTEMILVSLPPVPGSSEELLGIFKPVFIKRSSRRIFTGAIVATMREKALIENIVTPSILKSNYVLVTLGDTLLFENNPALKYPYIHYYENIKSTEIVRSMKKIWKITVFPPVNGLFDKLIRQNDIRFIMNGFASAIASMLLALALYVSNRLRLTTAKLSKSEERYRYLAENASDIILQQSISDGSYDYVSPAAERLTGYKPEEFYQTPFLFEKILAPQDLDRFRDHWQQSIEGKPPPASEYKIRHKSGEIRWLNQRNSLMYDKDGVLTAVEGILTDTTEQKKASFEREKLIKELEYKNWDLERFTYIISHELKTPLITIKGFLGYLEYEATKGDLSGFHEDIKRIDSATEIMGRLLNDLIVLNKIGRAKSEKELVDLNQLVNLCIDQFSEQIKKRAIRVVIEKKLPQVVGFRDELMELFKNLIGNSIKFTRENASPFIEIGVERSGGEQVFYIKDNGMGFESKYSDRIFGLFNKLDSTTVGTGAGLALVKRIIEHHGGWIRAQSLGIGKGATVYFTLPQTMTKE